MAWNRAASVRDLASAAQGAAEQSAIEASIDGTVQINNRNVVINSQGTPVVMGRNTEVVLMDETKRERARHRVPYGAFLYADAVFAADRAADAHALFQNQVARFHRARGQRFVALIEQNQRMQVAVARVKDVRDSQVELGGNFANLA